MSPISDPPRRIAWTGRLLLFWAACVSLAAPVPAPAAAMALIAPSPAPAAVSETPVSGAMRDIDGALATIRAIGDASHRTGALGATALARRADAAADRARAGVATLAGALAAAPAAQRAAIETAIARGDRAVGAATALATAIRAGRGGTIDRTVSTRGDPPLGAMFWSKLFAALPDDLGRLGGFMAAQASVTWRGIASGAALPALIGLIAAAALLVPVRRALRRFGGRVMINHVPDGRLRRSARAFAITAYGTLVPWLAFFVLERSFAAAGMVSAPWQPFAAGIVRGTAVAAAVAAAAGALLQPRHASWRLLPISDESARELRPWTTAAAVAVFVTVIVDELILAAGIGAPTRDAATIGEALLHSAVGVMLLVVAGRCRRRAAAAADADEAKRSAAPGDAAAVDEQVHRGLVAVALAIMAGALAVATTVVALAAGYFAFALLVAQLLVWIPLIAAILYIALLFTGDLCAELISGGSALGRALHRAFGVRASFLDQLSLVLATVLQLFLALVAAIAAFAPLGSNVGQLDAIVDAVLRGATIGQVTIAPGAIARALLVLAVALFVVRAAERWLAEQYLPKTELDEGARNSISTVARYVGLILASLWALTALGIGFERIALVLSALSVGIGFGLQAITQNFVSGLILLIERPVKIGDLVQIGDQKGDVKRISVRATEIQVADRSTLIVPNSDLITKTVRNMTHADPMGLVQIKFTVPLDTDVDAVRDLVLSLFKEAKMVFDDPEPKVMIDSIDDGAVHFNCTGSCSSPRVAYATRSEVLFRLIMKLREQGIAIGSSSSPPPAGAGAAPPPASA